MMTESVFTRAEREPLIRAILDARKELERAARELDEDDLDSEVLMEKFAEAGKQLEEAEGLYEQRLPRSPLSRCPFTGRALELAIDSLGLDGPWWDYEQPVRPPESRLETLFAFSGAVAITGDPPEIPFPVKPGPGAPWVAPRLLALPTVRAVVSTIQVGSYAAYPTLYFAVDPPLEVPRINDWGTGRYVAAGPDGSGFSGSSFDVSADYDFDLAPWIRRGRLLWIAPGDMALNLNSTLSGCPYLELSGYREPVLLRRGKLKCCLIDNPEPMGEGQ